TPVVTVSGGANVAPAGGSTFIVTAPANGTYTVTIDATDDAGNASSESFDIVVSQDEAPQPSLACNDDINVTLDANCSRVITADMVLEGSFGCLDNGDFVINIVNDADPSNLN
ncbi:hypothetical protein, partial [Phaeodactylibacter luteus]|uniref:hypothetical protein n=1 Tax=Phaeodactylibacter luteus TaxID=1564516 RepID=UPI00147846CA